MFPLILAVLHRVHSTPVLIPIKDCEYKGEHQKIRVLLDVRCHPQEKACRL